MSRHLRFTAVFLSLCCLARPSKAQQIAAAELPDAPTPQQGSVRSTTPQQTAHVDPQTKRILYIFPNFRAVSASTHLPAQSPKEKFTTAAQDSFDYSSFVLPLLIAGEGEITTATPEFHGGAAGYGRYFWHAYVDQTSENFLVEFIVPALTHEDTRYYTLGPGGGSLLKRAGYALTRSVITRNDAGKETFNISEVLGSGLSAGLSNLYYPAPERTASKTLDKWGLNIGIDAGTFIIREVWPDVNHALFHGKSEMSK